MTEGCPEGWSTGQIPPDVVAFMQLSDKLMVIGVGDPFGAKDLAGQRVPPDSIMWWTPATLEMFIGTIEGMNTHRADLRHVHRRDLARAACLGLMLGAGAFAAGETAFAVTAALVFAIAVLAEVAAWIKLK